MNKEIKTKDDEAIYTQLELFKSLHNDKSCRIVLVDDNGSFRESPLDLSQIHSELGLMLLNAHAKKLRKEENFNAEKVIFMTFGFGTKVAADEDTEALENMVEENIKNGKNLCDIPELDEFILVKVYKKDCLINKAFRVIRTSDKSMFVVSPSPYIEDSVEADLSVIFK